MRASLTLLASFDDLREKRRASGEDAYVIPARSAAANIRVLGSRVQADVDAAHNVINKANSSHGIMGR
ncbi:hypothetical protein AB0F17_47670 [Nonomuraea sp. NPDC026600]|uniref:hypothetical protein n=1 Tax=Nonomuraea sp. NPDC026600 TaxID=3155363 RepID=UPI0033D75CAE